MSKIPLFDQVAVLIDADNAQLDYIEQVLQISEYYGQLKICRAYGDWNKPELSRRCEKLDALNIECIQVDHVGKNATDNRLMMDAGEILAETFWGTDIHVFVIVSGDGDFTISIKRLQERGKHVIGIANKKQASDSLLESCDKFYYLEDLDDKLSNLIKRYPISPHEIREFYNLLFFAYHQITKVDWVSYSQLGAKLRDLSPDYKSKYSKYKLSKWLSNFDQDFESRDKMVRRIPPRPRVRHLTIW